MRMKPLPLINEEKLETQNGIANRRKVCHLSAVPEFLPPTLRIKPAPINALIPAEFNQMPGDGSK